MDSVGLIALAVIAVALVGGGIWAVVRATRSGEARSERDALLDGQKRRRKGDEVICEPVADESEWLRRQRRLHRMQNDSKP